MKDWKPFPPYLQVGEFSTQPVEPRAHKFLCFRVSLLGGCREPSRVPGRRLGPMDFHPHTFSRAGLRAPLAF